MKQKEGVFFQHEGDRYILQLGLPGGRKSWLSVLSHYGGEITLRSTDASPHSLPIPRGLRQREPGQEETCRTLLSLLHGKGGTGCIRQVYKSIISCSCQAAPGKEIPQSGTFWDVYSVSILWELMPWDNTDLDGCRSYSGIGYVMKEKLLVMCVFNISLFFFF